MRRLLGDSFWKHTTHYLQIFLPRDAIRKRGLCCRPVSVWPSVTLVHCIQMAEDIVKLLCRPCSPIILVFWPQGNPFSWDVKYKRVGNFCEFRLKSQSISETVWDRRSQHFWSRISKYLSYEYISYGQSYYRTLGLIGNHTQYIEWYHFQWPWLAVDWDFKVAIFFDTEYLRNDTS